MNSMQKIVLAGGCFWGMEDLFRNQPGVIETMVGYCGDSEETAAYKHVKTGRTNHAEAIEITYDAAQTTLKDLLDFFFIMHDPTTVNQQGNDRGKQYRSVIFANKEQRPIAEQAIRVAVQKWQKPVVTTVEPVQPFYPAETEHQNYLQRYPNGYTCHWIRKF